MHRIDGPTAAPALPAPSAVSGTPGYFSDGNPATQKPATTLSQDWANAVQEEIAGVIEGAGLDLDKTKNNQLNQAIDKKIDDKFAADAPVDVTHGEFAYAGGGLHKRGIRAGQLSEGTYSVNFRTPFPDTCLGISLTQVNATANNLRDFSMQIVTYDRSGFTAMVQKNGGDGATVDGFHWSADGY